MLTIDMHLAYGDDFLETIGVYMIVRDIDHELARSSTEVVSEFVTRPLDNYMWSPPAALISRETGQRLMDELWQMGYRPKGEHSPGQLAAVQNHLSWATKIAELALFKLLDK